MDESICTRCFLTIRAVGGKTLPQAEQEHKCPSPPVMYLNADAEAG